MRGEVELWPRAHTNCIFQCFVSLFSVTSAWFLPLSTKYTYSTVLLQTLFSMYSLCRKTTTLYIHITTLALQSWWYEMMTYLRAAVWIVLSSICLCDDVTMSRRSSGGTQEQEILNQLLANYDMRVRPPPTNVSGKPNNQYDHHGGKMCGRENRAWFLM